MKRFAGLASVIVFQFIFGPDTLGAITGHWNFDNSAAPLGAQIGAALQYLDGPGAETASQTQVATTTALGLPAIGGAAASVLKFGTNGFGKGYLVPHGIAANGDGGMVNNWSLIMDVLFPASSSGKWRALLQTNPENPESDDAEMYFNEANALGILGVYHGNLPANTWARIAFVADLDAASPIIRKYLNGVKIGEHGGTLDGRYALVPDSTLALFTDGYVTDIYTQPGYINSLQLHDEALSDAYIGAIGGPAAAGIPTEVPTRPYVRTVSPAAGPDATPEKTYTAMIENGITRLNTNSVRLSLNGEVVPTVVSPSTNGATVTFAASGLFAAGATNLWQLIFADDAATPSFVTNTVQSIVSLYRTLNLPEPFIFENFDNTPEGSLPAGWTNLSFTEITNPEEDLNDLNSASYARWTVVESERFKGSFITYSNPDNPQDWEDDYQRVLNFAPTSVVNNQLVTNFARGRFAFANSGYRNGASQVLDLYTPDFDLRGRGDVHLVFNSLWEQNQDSIAGVEFSVDGGQSWKPITYMIHQTDVVQSAGAIDAVATLNAEHGDVARYSDESGTELGGTYGAFIKAPINASLAEFISGRLDDDSQGSKRVEMFRLAAADNQAAVRFRFFHAGTDSWYFGLDNFGLYQIPIGDPPLVRLSISRLANNISLGWVGGGRLQKTSALTNPNWQVVPGIPIGDTNAVEAISGGAAFYRVVLP